VFSHPPEDGDFEITEFIPNPLVAIAASDHPLAGKKQLSIRELANEPFLMREQGSGTRYAIERHLQRINAKLNVRMTIESNEAIKHAVMSGLGISILSAHTLAFGGSSGLAELQVKELPIDSQWYLVRPSGKRLSLIAQAFIDFLETEGKASVLEELSRRD
jgi:DNA-binding transcriptional LysR family regulator